MNKVILIGRLTKDPEVRVSTGGNSTARYTLAVDRAGDGADFIPCVAFGKSAEFAEKYLSKGMKIAVEGRILTGSYTNKDNQKVYTTDVAVDRHEFCESKTSQGMAQINAPIEQDSFMSIPEGLEAELPFN